MAKEQVSLRIKAIMAEKGMTYADIAQRMTEQTGKEIKQAAVGARVTGNPSLSGLYELANALGVKVTQLFPEEDQCHTQVLRPVREQNTIACPYCEKKFALLS